MNTQAVFGSRRGRRISRPRRLWSFSPFPVEGRARPPFRTASWTSCDVPKSSGRMARVMIVNHGGKMRTLRLRRPDVRQVCDLPDHTSNNLPGSARMSGRSPETKPAPPASHRLAAHRGGAAKGRTFSLSTRESPGSPLEESHGRFSVGWRSQGKDIQSLHS